LDWQPRRSVRRLPGRRGRGHADHRGQCGDYPRTLFAADAGATEGFTFTGPQTLTIGRGGITNYAPLRQTFSNQITLGDHRYWDVGQGLTTAAVNTNGKLLEIGGSGTARITCAVTGTGGLALSGEQLEMAGSSSLLRRHVGACGEARGRWHHRQFERREHRGDGGGGGIGHRGGPFGAGLVGPGNSPGILTAPSVNPAGGLDFAFELSQEGSPTWANAAASGNDVLRLTDLTTPFTTTLGAANVINVYFGAGDTGIRRHLPGRLLHATQAAIFGRACRTRHSCITCSATASARM